MDLDPIVETLRSAPVFIFGWFVVMAFVLWKFWKQRRQPALADSARRYDPAEIIAIFQKRAHD